MYNSNICQIAYKSGLVLVPTWPDNRGWTVISSLLSSRTLCEFVFTIYIVFPVDMTGASGDHVFVNTYPPESEDFADSDASKLDTWVFDKVKVEVLTLYF